VHNKTKATTQCKSKIYETLSEEKIIQKLVQKTQNKKSEKLRNITDYHFNLK